MENTSASAWDDAMQDGESNKEKVEFTKLAEGITFFRVLDEAPHVRWTHWMNQHKRSINCPGYNCPICAVRRQQKAAGEEYTINMAKRYSINIINRSTGNLEILDQGRTFFDELRDFNREQDLREYDIKAKRKGMDTSTTYRLDKEEPAPLSEDDLAITDKTIDLAEYLAPHTPEQIQRILNGEDWNTVMSGESEEAQAEKEAITTG